MRLTAFSLAVLVATIFSGLAKADETPIDSVGFTLPKDGTWAKYYFDGTEVGNKDSGTFTLRMVGTTTENDQKCRWIEIQIAEETGRKVRNLMKLLVREKDFAAGAKTMPKILRGWTQEDDNPVTELSDEDKAGLALLFGNPKDTETVKLEKVIDYKKGQLKIATATRGKLNTQLPEAEAGVKADFTMTIWSHKKAPFGIAAMDTLVKTGDVVVLDSKMKLQDHGTGAKSAWPDRN